MTWSEALDFMGLEEGASDAEVKAAYREMSQILHPDRFNGNERLSKRATEQFKRLNEARDILLGGKGSGSRGASDPGNVSDARRAGRPSKAMLLQARLAGIQAARTAFVAQRDVEVDSRRNGLIMVAAGAIGLIAAGRIYAIKGIAAALAIWGIVKVVNARMTMKVLDDKLAELEAEKKSCESQLEEL